ncbi:tRNA lysidine(34) synthetase TilS [Dyadobacter luticola]|uniref:tRNA(Ile)-lysidine synthase n=1 Tax=Dyadobacter luticola TaxID=1979387 RepID=A0A5R9KYC0_9BACT|nr:tRNA lysidine(34) synthetase TilS [Dyadobacter luticola]TLV01306.1 tRNA lysidine(34) synthetase TilS [Dyadobacter luticola]
MDSFLTFINQFGLDFKEGRTLLTVSGGIDSVVLANLFHKMGFKAGIAHCNFGLRGEESDEDERFVRALAAHYGFDFYVKNFDVKGFVKDHAMSTQMAARELRYKWFEEIRERHHYRWIATAHHANDSFETVLLNLARGTGLAGLHGISGINGMLVRPLLYATRSDIEAYAEKYDMKWREDRSNDSDDYKRNLLRHHAMPVFKRLNPSLEQTFKKTSEKLKSADNLLNEFLAGWAANVIEFDRKQVKIKIDQIKSASEPEYRLWHIVQKYGFQYGQIAQILQLIGAVSGSIFMSATHRLLVDRQHLIIKEKKNGIAEESYTVTEIQDQILTGGVMLTFTKMDGSALKNLSTDHNTLLVEERMLIFPLTIRSWQQGDKFQPFGMQGKQKKISDLLIDRKLSLFEKEEVQVLINGNDDIIWVIGYQSDERYRVGKNPLTVLQIKAMPGPEDKLF